MAVVGFEPTSPERLVPKTSALDHSATLPHIISKNKFLSQHIILNKCVTILNTFLTGVVWRCGLVG